MVKPPIYLVSDSVGETVELVTKAALSQFNGSGVKLHRVPYVEDTTTIEEVISLAKMNKGMIVFTLVKPDIRIYLDRRSKEEGIYAFDVMGPLLDRFQQLSGIEPKYEPGLVRKLDEDYFKKIEAIEFAVKYDDGKDPNGVLKADIVLIGVSRTSKTPLSQFLALKRYKVANVPIVPEVDPPEELMRIDPKKCFGLKIRPEKLIQIRKERLLALGLNDTANYASIQRIKEELEFFDGVVNKIGCNCIDVTNKAVEETANVIIEQIVKSSL
ncbi:pyruvate, water dikinase regulatory protein [Fervidibacillus albus]|uniref:Putative pyruvate, phosphate dikinase regulatory protein n=1 Tax=Fervidibacillus albus TaxID=2980026 RepID=A0A9E8LVD1_9BACI|nr:pyruvate, water dikinase regulatory protein [Fervidibacillus albus]WAA10388.1 kinase/pyrophosphorylase [Fervidibacillus albus]